MLEELVDMTGFVTPQLAPRAGDEALHVRFYMRPRKDERASEEQGRPVYVSTEYVFIGSPGDKLSSPDRKATKWDKARFAAQYAAFKQGGAETVVGTPLSKWPLIEAHQVEEMKHFNVFTVEQLATMPDGNIHNIGNISLLKKQAADYLAFAKGNAPAVQLRAELDKRDAMMEAMQAQMNEQAALISELSRKRTEAAQPAEAVEVRVKPTKK